MKVYKLIINNSSMNLRAIEQRDHPITSDFYGDSKLENWSPIEVTTLYKKKYHDFVKLIIGKPIVSRKVKEVLEKYLSDQVEFLPLLHKDLELYLLNVVNVLDCLDWKRTDVVVTEENRFLRFNKIVFDFSKIPDGTFIFKIKETAGVQVYITEKFKDIIESNKIKGLDFSVVFDSELTLEKEIEQQNKFKEALDFIEASKGEEFSYDHAIEMVNLGKAVANGKWKLQLDRKGRFQLGELLLDLSYQWIIPVYIAPILLGLQWHEVERSEI